MIRTRMLPALAMAFALAACQQPNSSAGQSATVVDDDALARAFAAEEAKQAKVYKTSPFFEAKLKDVTVKMIDRMVDKCFGTTSEVEMRACFHERLLVGYDRDGTLKSHCPIQEQFDKSVDCIIFGGMGQRVAAEIGDDGMLGFDWTAPQESAHQVVRTLVLQELRNCLSNGSASDPQECFMGRVTKGLNLSESDLEPCAELKDDDAKYGACIGEAFGYKYIKEGVERM